MKTSIWANCPKCRTELKIDTDETELVQIECPDCHKVFAAKVPPRSVSPVHEVFSQMPVLPAFQPAHVHYKPKQKSDDSMNPAVLTALIVVCVSAILIPLGFGGYYVYSQLTDASQLAISDSASATSPENAIPISQQSNSFTPATEDPPTSTGFIDRSPQPSAFSKASPAADAVGSNPTSPTPPLDSTSQPDPNFGVPVLNPPQLIQSQPPEMSQSPKPTMSSAPTTPSPPTTSSPPPSGSQPSGASNPGQVQVTVSGAGTSKSGLPVPLHRFFGSSGVLIFVLHSKGQSVSSAVQELQRKLSIPDIHFSNGSDHTTVGIRYSGSVDSVVKGIQFGKVTYVDEESRSIHVQAN